MKSRRELRDAAVFALLNKKPKKTRKVKRVVKPMPIPKVKSKPKEAPTKKK